MKKFSKEQLEAIQVLDQDVCIFAGAGSGKTTLLVERFMHAVTEMKTPPESILAVTFTDKAAAEMKKRLVEQFETRGFFAERQKLEDAYIGTLHSFCARVLRENPVEAGVDPAFQILGEGEADILMDRLLDELFEEKSQDSAWLEMMADFGEDEIREALKNLYETYRALGGAETLFKINVKASEETLIKKTLVTRIEKLCEELQTPDLSKTEEAIKKTLKEVLGLLKETGEPSWQRVTRIRECENNLQLRSKKTKEAVLEIKGLLSDWISFLAQTLGGPVKKEFLKTFFEFRDLFDREKRKSGRFDFEDLLFWTYKLFGGDSQSQKAVLSYYQELFGLIFVDEYQDTSFLQHEIIRLLKKPGNLFVVGDLQQSIYGFRHAEPQLFFQISETKNLKKIVLRQNYRAREEILQFVNQVFEDKAQNPFFEPLEAKKEFLLAKPSAIDILGVEKDEEVVKTLDQARILEARGIAARIEELIRIQMPVQQDGITRPARYGDFAVLFKSSTAVAIYERALQDFSIPYYSAKGRGFFEKQEVMDVVNFLKILDNPNLDVSLAAVLRSPFVRVSEDTLFWLAHSVKNTDVKVPLIASFEKIEGIQEIAPSEKERVLKFIEHLKKLKSIQTRFRLSEIIERLLEFTDYETKSLCRPDGRQKLANVRKLVEMSRSLEEKGIFGIDDFVHFLKKLSETDMLLSEAKIEGLDQDTVKLFTVHSAKGLEFPFVVVADMGQKKAKAAYGSFLFSKEEGFGLTLENPLTGKEEEDASYQKSAAKKTENEIEEDSRLLYVAMTRAKEHLILSGCNTPGSWMERICKMAKTENAAAPPNPQPALIKSVSDLKQMLESDTELSTAQLESLGFSHSAEKLEGLQKRLLVVKKPYDHYEDLTVTDLLLAQAAEATVDFAEEPVRDFEQIDEEALPRNKYGTIFHAIMEHLVFVKPKKLHKKMDIFKIADKLSKKQKEELWQSVTRFWEGPLALEIRNAKQCFPELPFIYKTKHGILKGQIDLIFKNKAGYWVLVDYKTNQITAKDMEKTALGYKFQLELYALIFYKLYEEAPAKGLLYFSSLDKTSEFKYSTSDFKRMETELDRLFAVAALG